MELLESNVEIPSQPKHYVPRPITLEDYMPKSPNQYNESVSCYHINEEDVSVVKEGQNKIPDQAHDEENCTFAIIFTDEDMLLGDADHNRPLYVSGFACEERVGRILIDGGSAVNLIPLKTLKQLGIAVEDLLHSRLMIQEFNQGGQRAVGTLSLHLTIGEMRSSSQFHVIDSKTTQVLADDNRFLEAEAHFADAKYYTLKVKGNENPVKEEVTTSNNQKEDEAKMENGNTHVIRYTPKDAKKGDDHQLRIGGDSFEGLTLPAAKIDAIKQPCGTLKGFVASSESSFTNQGHVLFE
ncbi:hypothetical protein LIER_16507 [Lithospermum erythrorhizon]|uniref:Uncharacterized protein n=1 Tax=Lithospermum erythrorhizon TaxID=34254 RepID=A0AAV3Q6Y0_LITER